MLVVDARHGLADMDRALLAGYLPSGRPVLLLATKMDKLTPSAQRLAHAAPRAAIAAAFPAHARNVAVVPFSATRAIGREMAEARSLRGSTATRRGAARIERERRTKEKAPRSRGVTRGPNALGREDPLPRHPLREESGGR